MTLKAALGPPFLYMMVLCAEGGFVMTKRAYWLLYAVLIAVLGPLIFWPVLALFGFLGASVFALIFAGTIHPWDVFSIITLISTSLSISAGVCWTLALILPFCALQNRTQSECN